MTTINNFCTGCGQNIDPSATSCPCCGAPQGGNTSTPLVTQQSVEYVHQTHLFSTTDTTFKVRWTYWAWWAAAVVSFFIGHGAYLFGAAVMPYLFVSSLIKRKQWQHERLLNAVKANKQL